MYHKIKERVYEIIEKATPGDFPSKIFDVCLVLLIILNAIAVILETVSGIYTKHYLIFKYFEIVSIIIFTLEYLLRLWTCTLNTKYNHPFYGRIKAAVSPLALIDLMVVLPFYISILLPYDLRFLRLMRLFPLLLTRRIGKYSESLETFLDLLRGRKEELTTAIVTGGVVLIFASSFMYYVENKAQPEIFSSIPASMWWGVITLTTVGYGDVVPITLLGKLLGAIVAISGIGLFAFPIGILSSSFVGRMRDKSKNDKSNICPHCHKEINH